MASDRIELTGLRVVAPVGLLPEELSRPQPLELDLFIECDLVESGRSDQLANTVDYGAVIEAVQSTLTERHHHLLERAATVVVDRVLAFDGVLAVEVCVRKLRPPVPQDIAHTAVRIRRTSSPAATPVRRAYVALGSNLGDRVANLRTGIDALGPDVTATSRVFETEPIGGRDGQGPYLNMVVALDTPSDPFTLLRRCRAAEDAAHRVREERNGPRTLDADLLWVDGVSVQSDELTVPHPRLHERRFVLEPLGDLAPELLRDGWEDHVGPGQVFATQIRP